VPLELSAFANRQRDNEDMTEADRIRQWVRTWKQHGPELERIRLRQVRDEDQALSVSQLARALNYATSSQPPNDTSGLVEMQRYLAKLRP
jgi:hypothetical protein